MATFSLSDLKSAVDKKYAPTIVENGSDTYTLQNLLQLPNESRDTVVELIKKISDDDESGEDSEDFNVTDELEVFSDIIRTVEVNGKGQELIDLLGENTAMLIELGSAWMNGSELGEAVPS